MTNKHCTCPAAGFCNRHKIQKSEAQFAICRGEADRPDCGYKFWEAWETGKFGAVAQDPPLLDDWECESEVAPPVPRRTGESRTKATKQPRQPRYLGDHIEQALSLVGITKDRVTAVLGSCGCCGRQRKLNELDRAAREIVSGSVESGKQLIERWLGSRQ